MTVVSERAPEKPKLFSGPPRYQAESPWGPWAALLGCGLIFIGQIAGVGLGLVLIKVLSNSPVSSDDVMSLETPLGLAVMLGSQVASIVVVWLLAGRQNMRAQVLQMLPPKASWGTAVAGGLLVVAVTGALELILYALMKFDYRADTEFLSDGLKSQLWLGTVFMAVVLAPLWEELTFRGFLLSALAKTRLGFWPAALISNTAWTALHGQYSAAGIVSVFTAGLVLTWLLWRTGSIRVPIVAHGVANLFAVGFAWYMAQGVPG